MAYNQACSTSRFHSYYSLWKLAFISSKKRGKHTKISEHLPGFLLRSSWSGCLLSRYPVALRVYWILKRLGPHHLPSPVLLTTAQVYYHTKPLTPPAPTQPSDDSPNTHQLITPPPHPQADHPPPLPPPDPVQEHKAFSPRGDTQKLVSVVSLTPHNASTR